MHEWALAQSVIDATLKVVKEENINSPHKVIIGIGELQDIDPEIFKKAIQDIKAATLLKEVEFVYKIEPAVLKCNNCGHEWMYRDSMKNLSEEERENIHFIPETVHIYVKCPVCGSMDFEMENGRGVFIERIE